MKLYEAKLILETHNKVICHITGCPGSGKSTILKTLHDKYPDINYIELDDIEKTATTNLNFINIKRNLYTPDMFKKLHVEKQKILNNIISKSDKKIIIAGIHSEYPRVFHSDKIHIINNVPNYSLDIKTTNRFYLNVSPEICAKRFYDRAKTKGKSIEKSDLNVLVNNNKNIIKLFKELGYKPMTYDQILEFANDVL